MKTMFLKYQLPLFFLLSYLLSWWFMLLAPGQLAHGLAFAAAIVVALALGRTGLREWWSRVINFRAGRWFLIGPIIAIGYHLRSSNSTVQTFIMDIFFVDKNLGWALTLKDVFPFNSVILKTTNGGDQWTAENFPDSSKLIRTIFFFDSLNGFSVAHILHIP